MSTRTHCCLRPLVLSFSSSSFLDCHLYSSLDPIVVAVSGTESKLGIGRDPSLPVNVVVVEFQRASYDSKLISFCVLCFGQLPAVWP